MSLHVYAQASFDGAWRGTLTVGGEQLPLIFNIRGTEATLDSPKQGARGIGMSRMQADGTTIRIESEPLNIYFTGNRINDGCITGIFSQNGFTAPLVLVKGAPESFARPQEPQPPYPYTEEEVSFASAAEGLTLHGTLTLPAGEGPWPAAVLVTGSGTQNRDEEIAGHKPFKVIADYLTRNGIAVLRYDDREYTSRKYEGATTLDYAADAMRAAAFLRARTDIDRGRVGIAGHSEGGTIAFICAAQDSQTAFIVSLAGMTVSGAECLTAQNRHMLTAAGTDADTTDEICGILGRAFGEIRGMDVAAIRLHAADIAGRAAATASPQVRAAVQGHIESMMSSMNEWTAYFIACDPAEYISRVRCDVLALNGDKDLQVDAEANLKRLTEVAHGDARITVHKLEGLNHLFQHCESGEISEYEALEETFAPEALEIIATWINSL